MVDINPAPKLTNQDSSTDNSKQDIRVLNGATITNNKDTSINVTISNIGRRFREMPWWVQAVVAIIVFIAAYLGYQYFAGSSQKVAKFISIVERDINARGVDFMSANNSVLNTIPNNILQENGTTQWQALSRIWMRSGQTINSSYAEAAQCLKSGECSVGEKAKDVCRRAVSLTRASMIAFDKLQNITGININMSGTDSVLPLPTGVGEVRLPDMSNLFYVTKACGSYGSDR